MEISRKGFGKLSSILATHKVHITDTILGPRGASILEEDKNIPG